MPAALPSKASAARIKAGITINAHAKPTSLAAQVAQSIHTPFLSCERQKDVCAVRLMLSEPIARALIVRYGGGGVCGGCND